MKRWHPIRARRQRRRLEAVSIGVAIADGAGAAFAAALKTARPRIDHVVEHTPRPRPDQIQIKGRLADGQPVYIDAVALRGQHVHDVPIPPWMLAGTNALVKLELTFDFFDH